MDKSKIENLNPQEYTHLPHAEQHFEDHEQTDVAIRPLVVDARRHRAGRDRDGHRHVGAVRSVRARGEEAAGEPAVLEGEGPGAAQGPEGYPPLQGIIAGSANQRTPAQDMDQMRRDNVQVLAGQKPMREGLKPGMPIDRAIDEALSRRIFKTAAHAAGAAAARG